MDLQTRTVMGQVNIVDGQWGDVAAHALAVKDPAGRTGQGSRKGDLFVVVQLEGCDDRSRLYRQLCHSLVTTIRDTFYHSPTSTGASLRRAMKSANSLLLQAESATDATPGREANRHLTAGAVALSIRGRDVLVASVGSPMAYLFSQGRLCRLPENPEGLNPGEATPALGREPDVVVEISHAFVDDGDTFVVGDGRFDERVAADAVQSALSTGAVEDALNVLAKAAGGSDCTALVARVHLIGERGDSREWQKPPRVVAASHSGGEATRGSGGSLAGAFGQLRHGEALRFLGASAAGVASFCSRTSQLLARRLMTILRAALPGEPSPPSPVPSPERAAGAGPARARSMRGVFRVVALVFPLVALLFVMATYWTQVKEKQEAFDASLAQAAAFYQQSLGTRDPTQALSLLAQADGLLDAVAEVNAGDAKLAELRTSVAAQRDRVENVQDLPGLTLIRSYSGDRVRLRRIVVDGGDLYVLDGGDHILYRHQMAETMNALRPDDAGAVLFKRGDQVGPAVVGDLVDIGWVAAGGVRQSGGLIALEGDGMLDVDPRTGVHAVPAQVSGQWLGPVAVAGFAGNVYVLDVAAGQILRFLPSEAGYTSPPERYFSNDRPDELGGAVDFAIDGFVYVLFADCRVRKYERGVEAGFTFTGMPTRMKSCAAIFTAPDEITRWLYVADSGEGRVLQFDKQGRFARQFRLGGAGAGGLSNLSSIYVDELAARMYLSDRNSLYVATLPPNR